MDPRRRDRGSARHPHSPSRFRDRPCARRLGWRGAAGRLVQSALPARKAGSGRPILAPRRGSGGRGGLARACQPERHGPRGRRALLAGSCRSTRVSPGWGLRSLRGWWPPRSTPSKSTLLRRSCRTLCGIATVCRARQGAVDPRTGRRPTPISKLWRPALRRNACDSPTASCSSSSSSSRSCALGRSRSREASPLPDRRRRTRSAARAMLPFALTGAQKRVLRGDRRRPATAAADAPPAAGRRRQRQDDRRRDLALLVAIESGLQAAFMAPTELLAEQQLRQPRSAPRGALPRRSADRFSGRLRRGPGALADGSDATSPSGPTRSSSVASLSNGSAWPIIDEQHRFGVEQRRLLQGKGDRPTCW